MKGGYPSVIASLMLVSCTVNADLGGASATDASALADGHSCIGSLSNIGTADFQISFTVVTTESGPIAIVNERGHCGYGMFWDVRIVGGQIRVETDDEMRASDPTAHPLTELFGTKRVDDGQPHRVMIWRKSQTITIFVDGVTAGSASSTSSFGHLSPPVSETDPCDGQGCSQVPLFGSVCRDNTMPFAGTLSDLCLESP
jgi:hypothetical protein